MADEHDPKLSEHYRRLEPLEPPPALDQKILAAARRAADTPHAPLVTPAGRHRWYYGLAAAAVLTFAVALTLHMERERPDVDAVSTAAEPPPQLRLERELRGVIKRPAEAESQSAPKPGALAFTPDPKPKLEMAEKLEDAAPAPAPQRAPSAGARNRVSAEAPQRARSEARLASSRDANEEARQPAAASAPADQVVARAPENPERWLDRIAELRSRGRHAEADKELAEFRRVYPNYRLSEVMRERVEGK